MRTIALALLTMTALALGLAACGGDDVPSDAVATVGGQPISKADYAHWAQIMATGQAAAEGLPAVVPDPPDYARCIPVLRRELKVLKGRPKPTAAQLRAQCARLHQRIKEQTLGLLIQTKWIEQKAKELGVAVPAAQVRATFAQQKAQSFPKPSAFERFLRDSGGMTIGDILFRVRAGLLQQRISERISRDAAKDVSADDVRKYYDSHKREFTQAPRRRLLVIETKTAAQAERAKQAVASGMPWATAVKRFWNVDRSDLSIAEISGGELNVAKGRGEVPRALEQVFFAAPKNQLRGPIAAPGGKSFYVFKAGDITPGTLQPFEQVRDTIRSNLGSRRGQQKLTSFGEDVTDMIRGKTRCSESYVIELCENGPKPKTTSTPAAPAQ